MKLLNADQASEILGIPKSTLAKMRWAGNGCDFVKIGARIYYRDEDIERWLAGNRRSSTSDRGTPSQGEIGGGGRG